MESREDLVRERAPQYVGGEYVPGPEALPRPLPAWHTNKKGELAENDWQTCLLRKAEAKHKRRRRMEEICKRLLAEREEALKKGARQKGGAAAIA